MRKSKRLNLITKLIYASIILLYSVETPGGEPNAAELVRAVRKSENWLHRIDSLRFCVDGTWSHSPESIAARRAELKKHSPDEQPDPNVYWSLKPTYSERLEYAIDFRGKHLRYVEDTPGREYQLHVGDVNEAVQYTKWATGSKRYDLNSTTKMFEKLFGSLSWPRAQPHSFWWEPKDVEQSMHLFGYEEDFKITGTADYHGVPCHVLEYEPPNKPGQIHHWYIGIKDHLLYRRMTMSKSGSTFEYWTLDYKEIAPGCWIPMIQGYNIPGYNPDTKQYYVAVRRDVRITELKINSKLPEDLFKIEFEEGLTVYDLRSGKYYTHIDIPPSLIGRPLPKTDGLGINLATDQTNGKMLLVCFWDMQQRPSRNCLQQLSKRAQELKNKDIVVTAVQCSRIDKNVLNDWVNKNNIPFPLGMIEGDEKKIRSAWGVKSLPWLILTDKNHVVKAEGFELNELSSLIDKTTEQISATRKISGSVIIKSGDPQEGTELKVVPAQSGLSRSNTKGRFNLEYEPNKDAGHETDYYLSARHKARNFAAFQLIDENVQSIELKLDPAILLTGKVADAEGRYIANAEVKILIQAANWKRPLTYDITQTDTNGVFKFKAISIELPINGIMITAKGYSQHFLNKVDLYDTENDILKLETIRLLPANLSVSGIVLDENNNPIHGASVKVLGGGEPRTDTLTDAQGKFIVNKLNAGGIRIIASHSGNKPLEGFVDSEAGAIDVKVKLAEVYTPHRSPKSILGVPLPTLSNIRIGFNTETLESRAILVCFFSMQQRPSRNCIVQLAEKAQQLKTKDIVVIAVQASGIDKNVLNDWVKKNNITFPVGMIEGDDEKIRFAWGVKSLPWLILTDKNHIVQAEGFTLSEISEKLKQTDGE